MEKFIFHLPSSTESGILSWARVLGRIFGLLSQHTLWPGSLFLSAAGCSPYMCPCYSCLGKGPTSVEGVWVGSPLPGAKPGSLIPSTCLGTRSFSSVCLPGSKLPVGLVGKLLTQGRSHPQNGQAALFLANHGCPVPMCLSRLLNGSVCVNTCASTQILKKCTNRILARNSFAGCSSVCLKESVLWLGVFHPLSFKKKSQ